MLYQQQIQYKCGIVMTQRSCIYGLCMYSFNTCNNQCHRNEFTYTSKANAIAHTNWQPTTNEVYSHWKLDVSSSCSNHSFDVYKIFERKISVTVNLKFKKMPNNKVKLSGLFDGFVAINQLPNDNEVNFKLNANQNWLKIWLLFNCISVVWRLYSH